MLLHPCQEAQWPWHWGSWFRNATVALDPKRVASGELDVVQELRAVPAAQVRAMQRVIAEHAHCMHYVHATPHNGTQPAPSPHMARAADAFEISLKGVLALQRGEDPDLGAGLCQRVPWDEEREVTSTRETRGP